MGMNHQPLALPDRTDDRVAGNRLAAGRELNSHPFTATNDQGAARLALVGRQRRALLVQQAASDNTRQAETQPNVGVDLLDQPVSRIAQHTPPARHRHLGGD
jgi:hypothetical protein